MDATVARRMMVTVVVAGVAVVTACGGDEGSGSPPATGSAEEIAASFECLDPQPLSEFDAPIRGGAAATGVFCEIDGSAVHVFERAEVGDLDASDEAYGRAQGGSDENVERLVGAGDPGRNGCRTWLLITGGWFVLSDDRSLLEDLRARAEDADVRPVVRASPPASYFPPGCPMPG